MKEDAVSEVEEAMPVPFIVRKFAVDSRPVECRFFQPEQDGNDFVCRLEIDWPNDTVRRRIFGVDQVQALLLAMKVAHVDLLNAKHKKGLKVEWLEEENLGLPIDDALADLAPENSF